MPLATRRGTGVSVFGSTGTFCFFLAHGFLFLFLFLFFFFTARKLKDLEGAHKRGVAKMRGE